MTSIQVTAAESNVNKIYIPYIKSMCVRAHDVVYIYPIHIHISCGANNTQSLKLFIANGNKNGKKNVCF